MPEEEKAVAGAGSGAPCGACRTLRRRCVPGCVFAPYFTASDFAAVHAVFGASNVSKMLDRVSLPEHRRAAAATLVEEARARAADPTFGRVAYLRILQEVNDKARAQVDEARAEIAREFGDRAANLPVDVAAAAAVPEVKMEARRQVDAALKHAREQDARLLGVRRDNEARWREMHPEDGTGTTGNAKGIDDAKRRREPTTMLTTPRVAKQQRRPLGFPDERGSQQQMAAAEAEREKALLTRQVAAPAKQHGHGHYHVTAPHGETELPRRVPEVRGHGQQMSGASREEAMMRSVQAPAAVPRAGDAAADRTPGQGGNSALLEAMMQLAGAGDEKQQQQLVAPQHADKEYDITQDMMQLQELFDMGHMAELAREQKMVKEMTEMGQWNAAGGAMEQDVMTTMQQIPANTWQHQDQEMPQQMEELAQTTGNVSQQLAWAQQYHYHDPAAVHRASPWHHQMAAEAHQPAAASASQAASEQDMLLLLQQHQVFAAAESLSAAGGARQFDNLGAQYDDTQYDDTELTLGYGHADMHQQQHAQQIGLDIALGNGGHPDAETQALLQELAAVLWHGEKQEMIREQDVMTMTSQQGPDDVWLLEKLEQIEKESMPGLAKRLEIMSRQAEARHAQKELGMTEMARKQEMLMRQFVAPDRAREQELIMQQAAAAQQQQHHPVAQSSEKERKLEMLMKRFVAEERAREQELITQQAAAAQQHPVAQSSEKERKLEMLMRQFAAAGRAREQELIMQQQQPVAQQYSGTELNIAPGQGHPYWHQPTVQQMLQEQQLADAVGFGAFVRHQPDTTLVQQDAQPNGHQMGSSLPPLPPSSLSQLHAQASHQQRTDGWRWPGPEL